MQVVHDFVFQWNANLVWNSDGTEKDNMLLCCGLLKPSNETFDEYKKSKIKTTEVSWGVENVDANNISFLVRYYKRKNLGCRHIWFQP